MRGRDKTQPPQPLADHATGEWFRVPGHRTPLQRYDEAPPGEGQVHWYLCDHGWHAFRRTDVKPAKKRRK